MEKQALPICKGVMCAQRGDRLCFCGHHLRLCVGARAQREDASATDGTDSQEQSELFDRFQQQQPRQPQQRQGAKVREEGLHLRGLL